jgi:hypothetical protein
MSHSTSIARAVAVVVAAVAGLAVGCAGASGRGPAAAAGGEARADTPAHAGQAVPDAVVDPGPAATVVRAEATPAALPAALHAAASRVSARRPAPPLPGAPLPLPSSPLLVASPRPAPRAPAPGAAEPVGDADLCPAEPEDLDGWEDGDGCPDPDNDADRFADVDDACPCEPETFNGLEDEDGCPDVGRVVIMESRIAIRDPAAAPPDHDADGIVDVADVVDLGAEGASDGDRFADVDGDPAAIAAAREQGRASRGLTARVVDDAEGWVELAAFLDRHDAERAEVGLDLSRRVRFRVVDEARRPVHDAVIVVSGAAFDPVVGRTHADGAWDLCPGIVEPRAVGAAMVHVDTGAMRARAAVVLPAAGVDHEVYLVLPGVTAVAPRALDLAFLIDATGSMGDELAYVTAEVASIVRRLAEALPGVEVRLAATFYRDRGDARPLEQIPFTRDVTAFVGVLEAVRAEGGGDYPEDVDAGLEAAMTTLEWERGQAVRVLAVIGDAPPQRYGGARYGAREAVRDASRRGIRLLPVAASGANAVVEVLFRALGAATSTPALFLTDDSGLGASHHAPDAAPSRVELFADVLVRLALEDLRGRGMHARRPDHAVVSALGAAGPGAGVGLALDAGVSGPRRGRP